MCEWLKFGGKCTESELHCKETSSQAKHFPLLAHPWQPDLKQLLGKTVSTLIKDMHVSETWQQSDFTQKCSHDVYEIKARTAILLQGVFPKPKSQKLYMCTTVFNNKLIITNGRAHLSSIDYFLQFNVSASISIKPFITSHNCK